MLDRNIPPVVTDFVDLHLPAIRRRKLANGAELVVIADGTQPVAQLAMNWVGGLAEAPSIAVARMVSDGLREGATDSTADQLEELLDFNGAQLRTATNSHYSSVVLSVLSQRLAEVLPAVLDAVYHPIFPVERIDRMRQRIAASRLVELERVDILASEAAMRGLAGENHYLSRTLDPDEVMSIPIEQLRAWHDRVYTPHTMTAYLSGAITPELEGRVVSLLNDMAQDAGDRRALLRATVIPLNTIPTPVPIFMEKPGAQQCAVNISIPTIDRRHPDYARLRLAIYALGGYFGSRLMTNIREERGLTYGIQSLLYGYREGGVLEIAAATSPGSVDELIGQTMLEIERMHTNPLGSEELQRVRRGYFTRLAATLDTPFGISDFVMSSQLSCSPDNYFDMQVAAVHEATPALIAEMIECYIDPSRSIVTIAGVRS